MQENSTGKSNYNSLQASLRITRWHGLTSIVNYVWSKSLDNSSDGEDFEPNAAQPQDSNSPQLEYGPSNFNVPQRFTWNSGLRIPANGWKHAEAEERLGRQQRPDAAKRTTVPIQLSTARMTTAAAAMVSIVPMWWARSSSTIATHGSLLDLTAFALPCTIGIRPLGANEAASDCVPGTRHYGTEGRDSLTRTNFQTVELLDSTKPRRSPSGSTCNFGRTFSIS